MGGIGKEWGKIKMTEAFDLQNIRPEVMAAAAAQWNATPSPNQPPGVFDLNVLGVRARVRYDGGTGVAQFEILERPMWTSVSLIRGLVVDALDKQFQRLRVEGRL